MSYSGMVKSTVVKSMPAKEGLSSSQFILLSLFAGIITGIVFGEMVAWLQFVGDIFIKLLQITVIPYISLSLITGLGGLKKAEVRGLAGIGGAVLLLVWVISCVVIMLAPLSFPDWPSASYFSLSLTEAQVMPDFLRLFIPSNPFYSYANAVVPAVVVFSILVGIALISVDKKEVFIEPLVVFREALMKITGIISRLAPIGVFSLLASAVGSVEISALSRLQVYIIVYALLSLVMALWILPALIAAVTPLRYGDVLRALRTPLVTGFATGSSLIVLPLLVEQCKYLIAQSREFDTEDEENAEALVEVLIPTAYPFLSPSVLLILIYLLFGGWYTGSAVEFSDYPMMIMAGLPTLFGGQLIAMPVLLDLLKLPQDLFQIFVSVDVITTRFGTLLSAMHYSTIALIGAFYLMSKTRIRWIELIKLTVIGAVLISVVLFSVRSFYTYVIVAPYTKADVMRGLQLRGEIRPSIVYESSPVVGQPKKPATFSQIIERGVLRVCFQPNEYPSSFYNSSHERSLVGFDIEMAHRLANLNKLSIDFIAANDESVAANLLDLGSCDIYMRTIPVRAGRTEIFNLTMPVYTSSIGVIVKDYRRKEFSAWDLIHSQGNKLTVAVDISRESQLSIRNFLPEANIISINNMDEQAGILESGNDEVDAIIDSAEEGSAWSVLYPHYGVVVPQPTIFIPVAYAVAKGNDELLAAVNAWILGMRENGVVEEAYEHWMLGGAAKAEKPPRWSVIKDVLKWVD